VEIAVAIDLATAPATALGLAGSSLSPGLTRSPRHAALRREFISGLRGGGRHGKPLGLPGPHRIDGKEDHQRREARRHERALGTCQTDAVDPTRPLSADPPRTGGERGEARAARLTIAIWIGGTFDLRLRAAKLGSNDRNIRAASGRDLRDRASLDVEAHEHLPLVVPARPVESPRGLTRQREEVRPGG
jgi:hypothetical protein